VPLTGKQRRRLRALGHHLTPVVLLGQNGVTPGVLAAVDQALFDHELIKVKIGPEERDETAEKLATENSAEVAQLIGRTLLLYRANADAPKINPNGSGPVPKPIVVAEEPKPAKPPRAGRGKKVARPRTR
jgi:RNA-binding protein